VDVDKGERMARDIDQPLEADGGGGGDDADKVEPVALDYSEIDEK